MARDSPQRRNDWGRVRRTRSGVTRPNRSSSRAQTLAAALTELEATALAPEDRFDGETLFINGGKSRYVKEADHGAILRHFPNARIETIAAAGHNPHMESRQAFVALLTSALS